jgi:arsenate reductase
MAAALLNARSGGIVDARSAGVDPEPHMSPIAVEALREIDLDVGQTRPRRWSAEELATSRVIWLGGPVPAELDGCEVESWNVSQEQVADLTAAGRLRHDLERRITLLLTVLSSCIDAPAAKTRGGTIKVD